jgi:hypothetical protein
MRGIAVRREDGDFVAAVLQAHSSVDDEPLGTANTQIRVQEHNLLAFRGHDYI